MFPLEAKQGKNIHFLLAAALPHSNVVTLEMDFYDALNELKPAAWKVRPCNTLRLNLSCLTLIVFVCEQVWMCSWGRLQWERPPARPWKSPSRTRVCPSRRPPASVPPMSPSPWVSPSTRPRWMDVPARYTSHIYTHTQHSILMSRHAYQIWATGRVIRQSYAHTWN